LNPQASIAQEERREPSSSPHDRLEMGETVMTLFRMMSSKSLAPAPDKEGPFTQIASLEITPKTWERMSRHARTFCFFEEIEFLIRTASSKAAVSKTPSSYAKMLY